MLSTIDPATNRHEDDLGLLNHLLARPLSVQPQQSNKAHHTQGTVTKNTFPTTAVSALDYDGQKKLRRASADTLSTEKMPKIT